jgi:hypothetical protein
MATFQANRPFSSSELLSLQRQKVEKSLNIPPSINIQDSSELTARVRKGASVMKTAYLPGHPTRESSGNMVKFNDCSVVQAMLEGNAYRSAACNYHPRTQYVSAGCQTILNNPVTYPKAVTCVQQTSNASPRVDCFDPVVEFGWRKNDNKAVIFNVPIPLYGVFSYMNYTNPVASCAGTVARIGISLILTTFPSDGNVTSISVVGHPDATWDSGEGGYGIYIPGITLPLLTETDRVFPISLLINDGAYSVSGSVTITDHFGNPLSTPQLYSSNLLPTDTGGSLYFPGSLYGYMCAGSNSDFVVPENSDFTIMWWQKSADIQFPRPFSLGSDASGDIGVSLEGAGLLLWYPNIGGLGTNYHAFTTSSIKDNHWHHVGIIRTSGMIYVYIDGVCNSSFSYSGPFGSAANKFVLGQRYPMNNSQESFQGYITQFVFDNSLARYYEDFNVPTTVTADPSYTVLLLNVSDLATAGKDDSGRGHNFGFYGTGPSNTPGFAPRTILG